MSPSYVGIDVGARRLHAVKLTRSGKILDAQVFASGDRSTVADFCSGSDRIAIDSPDRWSKQPHKNDKQISQKFKPARCAEIALGRQERYWVPWVTPAQRAPGSWIDVGIKLFDALRASELDCIEVYPYAVYRHLSGRGALPKKTSLEGITARVALLQERGVDADHLTMWSHDGLDATVAALVAADPKAVAVECDCERADGSAMWLPAAPRRIAET